MSCSVVVGRLCALFLLVNLSVACDTDSPNCVQEDDDDPDMIMHMQMRLGVDHSLDTHPGLPAAGVSQEKPQAESVHQKVSQNAPEQKPPALPAVSLLQEQEVTVAIPVKEVGSVAHGAPQGIAVVARIIAPGALAVSVWARSLPFNFLQIVAILGVISVCLLLRKVVNAVERKAINKRSALTDPSAKLTQLLRTLRFDEPSDDVKLLPTEAPKATYQRSPQLQEVKPQAQKQDVKPQANDSASDSGNNTEEEPETEYEEEVDTTVPAVAKPAKKAVSEPRFEVPLKVWQQPAAEDTAPVGLEAC